VFARDLDLPTKRQVVADEDSATGNDTSWYALVMAVSDADQPAVVVFLPTGFTDLDEAKVAGSFMAERVCAGPDVEALVPESCFDLFDQVAVWHWIPGFGVFRCRCAIDLVAIYDVSSTVEK